MTEHALQATVRKVSPFVNAIDIEGDITGGSEPILSQAYASATEGGVRTVIFNFTNLGYMNSLGMGTLVTLLIRSHREKKNLVSYGLNEHYRRIFAITHLDQVLHNYETEAIALDTGERMDLPEREY